MEYFWKQYEELPAGIGYERFSLQHFITLFALFILIAAALILFGKLEEKQKKRILAAIPLLMILLECTKDSFLLYRGYFGVGYLPLHLCSLGIFVFLAASLSRSLRWKKIFGEIAVTLILPGSIAALIFPDWAHLYPVWNFLNLYGYLYHGLLVLYPLLMLRAGQTDLTIRHIHYDFLFLLCVVPPVYLFDKVFACNYMFVNWPPRGTPLAWIAQITGDSLYLLGYAFFAAAVIVVIYLLIGFVAEMRKNR